MPNTIGGMAVGDAGTAMGGNLKLYPVVALDETFTAPNFRTGDQSYAGQMAGKGLWSTIGRWWSPGIVADGYGFDRFLSRDNPAGSDLYALVADGLRLRSKPPVDTSTITKAGVTVRPWLSPHMSTYYSLRLKPSFVVEFDATFPQQTEGKIPFSALWLYTCGRNPDNGQAREAEVDIEVFGNRLALTLHDWPYGGHAQYDYPLSGIDLTKRHRYTLEFRGWGLRFLVDDVLLKTIQWPTGFAANQYWQIILNNSSGVPWGEQGKPFLYPAADALPSDMIVHSVRAFAETDAQIWRNGI